MSQTRPAPLVLDLDTGIDDALALAYALGSPEVELVAVVCSYGNVPVELAARNTCALLELLGRPDVPVYLGCDRALEAEAPFSVPAGVVRIHDKVCMVRTSTTCLPARLPTSRLPFGAPPSLPGSCRA